MTVFEPVVGQQLVGRVVNIAGDHIGLLVYGIFNCSIPAVECEVDQHIKVVVECIDHYSGLLQR